MKSFVLGTATSFAILMSLAYSSPAAWSKGFSSKIPRDGVGEILARHGVTILGSCSEKQLKKFKSVYRCFCVKMRADPESGPNFGFYNKFYVDLLDELNGRPYVLIVLNDRLSVTVTFNKRRKVMWVIFGEI